MAEAKKLSLDEIEKQARQLREYVWRSHDLNRDFYAKKGMRAVPVERSTRTSYIATIEHAVDGYKKCSDSLPDAVTGREKENYESAKKAVEELAVTIELTIEGAADKLTYESDRMPIDALTLAKAVEKPSAGVLKEINRKRSYVRDSQHALQALKEIGESSGILDKSDKERFELRYATMQKALGIIDKVKAGYESGEPLAPAQLSLLAKDISQTPLPEARHEKPPGDDDLGVPSFLRRPLALRRDRIDELETGVTETQKPADNKTGGKSADESGSDKGYGGGFESVFDALRGEKKNKKKSGFWRR